MISVLKKMSHVRTGPFNRLLVFFAAFMVLMGESIGVIYIAIADRILPTYLAMIFQFVGYIIGGLILYHAIKKIPPAPILNDSVHEMEDIQEATEPKKPKQGKDIHGEKSKNSSIAFIMNFLIAVSIIKLLQFLLPIITSPDRNPSFPAAIALALISIAILGTVTITAWLITHNSAKPSHYFTYLIKSTKMYLTSLKYMLFNFFGIILISIIILSLNHLIWPILFLATLSPLLPIFYKTMTLSCLFGWVVLFLMKSINIIYGHKVTYNTEKGSPLGYIIIGLCLVALVYASIPGDNSIESEYEVILTEAEIYRSQGNLYLCGNEYKKAYALMKAYNGYLLDMQMQKDKNATDEQLNKAIGQADVLFRQAYGFYPNGGKIYYLDALRQLERSPSSSLNLAKDAKKYDPESAEAHLLLLNLSHELGQDELKANISKELIAKGIYRNTGNMNSMSSRKIDTALESIDENIQVCLENITTIAYDYYNNQLYPEAMEELMMIREIIPNDLAANYLIAMTDLELKSDNKAYTAAIEAAQTILDLYPNERWAQELYNGVLLRAGNQNIMDTAIKDAYERNPDNLDIAEQYAYSILKKNYVSSYYDVTQQAEEVVDKVLEKDDQRWFALYCKSLIELYKGEYESSLEKFNEFSKLIVEDKSLFSIYDELYNTYVVKCARRMMIDGSAKEFFTTNDDIDSFTFNYVMGAFGTMSNEVDEAGTIDFLTQALTYNSNFSKPYYMIGNAYMEYGVRNNQNEYFLTAEENYNKSIRIFENDPYAWFALAHSYKKQEKYEDAMEAFKKTLTLMPSQDHQSDHFGISIHSTYQLSELEDIISAKEGQ